MVITSSHYVLMRDTTRIAVTVHRPDRTGPVPVVVRATRYWRLPRPGEVEGFTGAGLALAVVDVRGTGASYGTWAVGWSRREIADIAEVVDWLVAQPWCTGAVGAWGKSYDANTALLLAAECHPAVRAVVPLFPDYDPFTQIHHPGGVLATAMISDWSRMVAALDRGDPSVITELAGLYADIDVTALRVDEDTDGALLTGAIADHAGNPNLLETLTAQAYREDSDSGPRARRGEIERSDTAIWLWASWYDAGTGAGAVEHFRGTARPDRVTILSSTHGNLHVSPYVDEEPRPVLPDMLDETVRYLRERLTGDPVEPKRTLEYWTIGTETLHRTSTWPVTTPLRVYPNQDGSLTGEPGTGTVTYKVDPTTTTGPTNNPWYQFNGSADRPMVFTDRATEDTKLLCHTGKPLSVPLELTGEVVVGLTLESTRPDGVVFAYLETVAPDGRVRCLTEGCLRLSHRQRGEAPSGVLELYHSHRAEDARPMTPGSPETVSFALLPISVVIPAGERLRLAVAGADHGTFASAGTDAEWTIHLGTSWLDLPQCCPGQVR
ncbi:CocE/NonD family hydrolase [Actinocrispum wychmicini]|nr:CocE/NonD family hydrolase [Actinocrispum wychmicini]